MIRSSRQAYTVAKIDASGKKAWVQADLWKRIDHNGMSECQSYEFTQEPDAPLELITLRKDGKWHLGTTMSDSVMVLGVRHKYFDPSF